MNVNALMCSVYVKTHESDLYVSVVLTDNAQAVYSRTLEVLRDELTDGEENALLDVAQCAKFDSVFTADMLRDELSAHIAARSATGVYSAAYGVLLHSMNNVTDYYKV